MVANPYRLIAVSGTHGKTTTTAMLIDIFEGAGKDPTAIVGSLRAKTQSNYRAGKGEWFIAEACEYKRDFLTLMPEVLVITNIEHEHVDCYPDLASVQAAFRELAERVPETGAIICNPNDPAVAPVITGLPARIIDYMGYISAVPTLMLPGAHNRANAAAAHAAALACGITPEQSTAALTKFSGVWRRFEYKGDHKGAPVIDDYAHHPTEVRATIRGARERYPEKRIVIVFQPHTYSRLAELFDDFVSALGEADDVHLLPVYAAREEPIPGATSAALAEALVAQGVSAHAYASSDALLTALHALATPETVLLIVGAGDVVKITPALLEEK